MIRIFLIGMLCGVMITAAVTYVFAIPANSDYWRMEIYKRGGAAWTVDRKLAIPAGSGWLNRSRILPVKSPSLQHRHLR